jgi:hypothetical protein
VAHIGSALTRADQPKPTVTPAPDLAHVRSWRPCTGDPGQDEGATCCWADSIRTEDVDQPEPAFAQAIDLGLLADRGGVMDVERNEPTDSEPAETGPAQRPREKSGSDAPPGDDLPIPEGREEVAARAKGRRAGDPRYENSLGSESPRSEDVPRNRSGGCDHAAEFTATARVSYVDSLRAMLGGTFPHAGPGEPRFILTAGRMSPLSQKATRAGPLW